MKRGTLILGLGLVAVAVVALSMLRARQRGQRAAVVGPHRTVALPGFLLVRDAGPREMRHPPGRWDPVDEAMDETFPASDPPARY